MSKDKYFKQKNLINEDAKLFISPSTKYNLEVSLYSTLEGCWNYSRGIVKDKDGNIVADVKRNYPHFPFCWVESHFNGHDYLVCGEDYQGQTIIELDTGNRKDYLPDEAKNGFGFCWVSFQASPNTKIMAVEGCYWACPYEVIFVDFSDPMNKLTYLENQPNGYYPEFHSWNDDNTANIGYEKVRRKSDGKWEDDLPENEIDIMYEDNDFEEVKISSIWEV